MKRTYLSSAKACVLAMLWALACLAIGPAAADDNVPLPRNDAFYTPPGHIPVKHEPGGEVLMFSPADELHKTEAVMMKNLQALQTASS